MKRNGTDFEGKPREHEDDAKQLTIRNAIFHGQSYIIEARRAGKAVEQGNAIKQNPAGQCAQDEIFKYRDRKSVVKGKSVSVRVEPGGRRTIKKKKIQQKHK